MTTIAEKPSNALDPPGNEQAEHDLSESIGDLLERRLVLHGSVCSEHRPRRQSRRSSPVRTAQSEAGQSAAPDHGSRQGLDLGIQSFLSGTHVYAPWWTMYTRQ